jgi:hypothetical protein
MHAPREDQYTIHTAARCALSVGTAVHLHRRLATIGAAGSVPFLLRRARADRNAVCSLNPYRLRQINWILALECEMRSKDSAERERKSAYLIWQQAGVADGEHHKTCNKQTALVNNFKSSLLKNDISEVDLNMQLHVKSSNFLSCCYEQRDRFTFGCIFAPTSVNFCTKLYSRFSDC